MARFTVAGTALVSAVCLLAGCQGPLPTPSPSPTPSRAATQLPTPTPTPTPSPRCTPEAGGAEYPCTQAQYDEMKAKDALYAEAEAVYREFYTESVRLSRAGGTSTPTDALLQTLSAAALDDFMRIFTGMLERGIHAEGSDPELHIVRLPGKSKAGSIVALSVCIDSRNWAYYRKERKVAPGRVAVDEAYFSRVGSVLRIVGTDGREVSECP